MAATLITVDSMPLAEARANLSAVVRRVSTQHDRVAITVHGRPEAVIISTDDLDALEETIEILSDTDTMRLLAASDAELARGETVGADELDAAMDARRRKTT